MLDRFRQWVEKIGWWWLAIGLVLLILLSAIGTASVPFRIDLQEPKGAWDALVATTPTPTPTPTPLPTPTPDPACQFPDRLREADLHDEAIDYYQKWLSTPEASACAESGLIATTLESREPKPAGPMESMRKNFTAFTRDWGWIVLLAIFGSVVGFRLLRPHQTTKVDITPFEKGMADGDIGGTMAELVQFAFSRIDAGDRPASAKIVVDAAAAATIPNTFVAFIPDPGGFVSKMMTALAQLGITTYTVTGTLVHDQVRGAGVILSLQHRNAVIAAKQIWYRNFFGSLTSKPGNQTFPDGDYLLLAETAAIWLHNELARIQRSDYLENHNTDTYSDRWRDWTAFALFRNSVVLEGIKDNTGATHLLEKSLVIDGRFIPALINRARLAIEDVAKSDRTEMERRLELNPHITILGEICNHPFRPRSISQWLAANYNLLAAFDYAAGWNPVDPSKINQTKQITDRLINLYLGSAPEGQGSTSAPKEPRPANVGNNTHYPWELARRRSFVEIEDYRETLRRYQASVVTAIDIEEVRRLLAVEATPERREMLVSEFMDSFHWPPQPELPADGRPHRALYETLSDSDPYLHYGLACLFAAAFAAVRCPTSTTRFADDALGHLEDAIRLNPGSREWARVDPSLTPLRTNRSTKAAFNTLIADPPRAEVPEKITRTEHVILFEDSASPWWMRLLIWLRG